MFQKCFGITCPLYLFLFQFRFVNPTSICFRKSASIDSATSLSKLGLLISFVDNVPNLLFCQYHLVFVYAPRRLAGGGQFLLFRAYFMFLPILGSSFSLLYRSRIR